MALGIRLTALFLCFCAVAAVFCAPSLYDYQHATQPASAATQPQFTVVLDAGHGGEDGGAVSASGIYEKDVNLAIARSLEQLLTANGISVVMTRTEDVLLYDRNVDFRGRKKALDLAARRKIAEETENAVFVSIHMNAYPKQKYSGLQVWYSKNSPLSQTLAQSIQSLAAEQLQPENDRKIKPATSSIYLLHRLECPAVLVECGFLSNPEEAKQLGTKEYQDQLAFLLFLSITDGLSKISSEISSNP